MRNNIREFEEIEDLTIAEACQMPYLVDGRPRFAYPLVSFDLGVICIGGTLMFRYYDGEWYAREKVQLAEDGFDPEQQLEADMDLYVNLVEMAKRIDEIEDPRLREKVSPFVNPDREVLAECKRRLAAIA